MSGIIVPCINQSSTHVTEFGYKWVGKKTSGVGRGMEAIYYGAWIARASSGGFVAELADFPEITAFGLNQEIAAMLASIRLSAHIAALRQRGAALLTPTGAIELLDGCIKQHAVARFLEIHQPTATTDRAR